MSEIRNLGLSLPDLARKPLFGPAPPIEILKNLNFEVSKGEVLGIVGGSGSGKTTLGRAMLRLLEPTSGTIHFDGVDITHLEEAEIRDMRRRFQMIFQDPMSSLNPRRQISGLISAPLALHGFDKVASRATEALDMVGLPASIAARAIS